MSAGCLRQVFLKDTFKVLLLRGRGCPMVPKPHGFSTSSSVLDKKSIVPQHPVGRNISDHDLPPKTEVNLRMVQLLEKLSLVDFGNQEGIAVLEAAISMADGLRMVDTEGVEPMVTVLEDRCVSLGEDEVNQVVLSEELLDCADTVEDDYFVVPPGNISYTQEKDYHTHLKHQHQ